MQVKSENSSLPVTIRVSKTRVLKLPLSETNRDQTVHWAFGGLQITPVERALGPGNGREIECFCDYSYRLLFFFLENFDLFVRFGGSLWPVSNAAPFMRRI